jgi:hypothetical protein
MYALRAINPALVSPLEAQDFSQRAMHFAILPQWGRIASAQDFLSWAARKNNPPALKGLHKS